jgi:hypothetical protein
MLQRRQVRIGDGAHGAKELAVVLRQKWSGCRIGQNVAQILNVRQQ